MDIISQISKVTYDVTISPRMAFDNIWITYYRMHAQVTSLFVSLHLTSEVLLDHLFKKTLEPSLLSILIPPHSNLSCQQSRPGNNKIPFGNSELSMHGA
mmetsp:Transcript_6607/g.10180  ORF Transcript_6607/g.10180 Transcript_6607/m.10180 type:complete len:99 (-) Transcript_6607:345-641(-)